MSQPNFQVMDQQELKRYVLEHREDIAAFHAYVDKLHAEGRWIDMPPMQSEQDLENYPEFLEHIRRNADSQDRV
jgi:hypothetical protein